MAHAIRIHKPGAVAIRAGSGGIHWKRLLNTNELWRLYPSGVVTRNYSQATRGNGINDIWVTGDFGEVVHYNGYSWHNYTNEIGHTTMNLLSVKVKGNLVVGVGYDAQYAAVLIGRRSQ